MLERSKRIYTTIMLNKVKREQVRETNLKTSVESALKALAVAFFTYRCQYGTTLINTKQLTAKTTTTTH